MNKSALGFFGLLCLAYTTLLVAQVEDPYIAVLHSDKQGLVLELSVPAFSVQVKEHDGVDYRQVVMPEFGFSQDVGKPQVPVRGTLIGLPVVGDISIEVLDAPYRVLSGDLLYPAPARVVSDPGTGLVKEQFAMDEQAYQTDVLFPAAIVQEGFSGYMRDQPVVQLLFYPAQFNPVSEELRVYEKIKVKITFDDSAPTGIEERVVRAGVAVNPTLGAYEVFIQDSLINYSSLQRSP